MEKLKRLQPGDEILLADIKLKIEGILDEGKKYFATDSSAREYIICNKDAIVFFEGEESLNLYILKYGGVNVERDNSIIANIDTPNEIIGEMGVLLSTPRSATVKAAFDNTLIYVLNKPNLKSVTDSNPAIGIKISTALNFRIFASLNRLALNMGYKNLPVAFEQTKKFLDLPASGISLKTFQEIVGIEKSIDVLSKLIDIKIDEGDKRFKTSTEEHRRKKEEDVTTTNRWFYMKGEAIEMIEKIKKSKEIDEIEYMTEKFGITDRYEEAIHHNFLLLITDKDFKNICARTPLFKLAQCLALVLDKISKELSFCSHVEIAKDNIQILEKVLTYEERTNILMRFIQQKVFSKTNEIALQMTEIANVNKRLDYNDRTLWKIAEEYDIEEAFKEEIQKAYHKTIEKI